jgi:predicted RNA-binding protein with PIN domain
VAPDLYLFDGYNLLHAGGFRDERELADALASYVAVRGARGIVVFDGVGDDTVLGPLEVRWAPHADTLIERLAAERRELERVLVVTGDRTLSSAVGLGAAKLSSKAFLRDFDRAAHREDVPGGLAAKLDAETAARLERLRRGG